MSAPGAGEQPADVVIFTAGGTIDAAYFDALSDSRIGDSVVPESLRAGCVQRHVQTVGLLRKDSLHLVDADPELICNAVVGAPKQEVIITHGTDTPVETAQLPETATPWKTIALVAALASDRSAQSDASSNLGMAFAAPQLAGPGAHIAMNGMIFEADQAGKDRAAGKFVAA